MTRDTRPESIHSDRAPEPVGAYPHAKRYADLLFISGVGPRRKGDRAIPGVTLDESGRVVDHDIRAQAGACFENVRAILEDAGSSWDRIIDVLVFLTHMQRDFAAFNEVYAEWFGQIRPARTTVEVGALPTPIAVELKVIAGV